MSKIMKSLKRAMKGSSTKKKGGIPKRKQTKKTTKRKTTKRK